MVSLRSILGFVDDGVSASGFEGTGGKSVSVERFAFQGDEEGIFGAVAAVGSDAAALQKQLIEGVDIHSHSIVYCM